MAPIPSKASYFYLSPDAVRFEFNALGDPDNISVSIYHNAKFAAFVREVDALGFTPADEYKKWTLSAFPTHFTDDAGVERYCHVAVQRSGSNATLVYPASMLDVYGRPISDDGTYFIDNNGNQIADEPSTDGDYFFFFLGKITSSNYGSKSRGWSSDSYPVTGTLDTARYREEEQLGEWSKMFTFNDIMNVIEQHYPILVSEIKTLILGGKRIIGIADKETPNDSDDTLLTPASANDRYLSRKENDTAMGHIQFHRGLTVRQEMLIGQFVTGMVGGSGGRIDEQGNAELESLILRSFLEVPEFRFNRIDVVSGELWNSIAFGTIDHVEISADGKGGTAWLHLEKTERSGLHIHDICRGIFSDFGDGSAKDNNDDDNGFKKVYGFSTAYFTPTDIIENGEGVFVFRYSLQPGTTTHPCAFMKFAVYGSFSDPTRRASAYMTRTYMRYLKNVDTWKINPDNHIASQFGNLDGLSIGGMVMQGEGTFLSNIYMTGALIQFTPQQREELKGDDAYSVTLTDYEALLHIDIDGNVIGMQIERNVVSMDANGVTISVHSTEEGKDTNVIDLAWNATTTIQAYRGSTPLVHVPVMSELGYVVNPSFVNCEGFVTNGVLVVNRVNNTDEDAWVDIEVNCEGNAVFQKHFAITVLKDPLSSIIADLDNEMDTVVEHSVTGDIIGTPLVTTGRMYYGNDEMEIVSMDVPRDENGKMKLPQGITIKSIVKNLVETGEKDDEGNPKSRYMSATVTIGVDKTASASSAITFNMSGKKIGAEKIFPKQVRFLINKTTALFQFKLTRMVSEVKVGDDGTFGGASSRKVGCKVLVNDGSNAFVPESYADIKKLNARVFYEIDYKGDVPTFKNELNDTTYASGISVTNKNDSVTFWIYYYPNGIDKADSVRFDMETIHVLYDAVDSLFSMVFKRSNTTVEAPDATEGSFAHPVPTGWYKSIPEGKEKVWVTTRKFTSNGQNQDDAWSTPRELTDTSDFDVCYHDGTDNDQAPAPPAKTCHGIQGPALSGSNGWYNDSKDTTEWVAIATCSNGDWADWQVSRIGGKSILVADLVNEADAIGVGEDGILDVETVTSTKVSMYYGLESVPIKSVTASGLPKDATYSFDDKTSTLSFSIKKGTDFTTKNRYQVSVTVVGTFRKTDYTRTLVYTIVALTEAADGVVFFIQPSATCIKKTETGTVTPTSLICKRFSRKGLEDAKEYTSTSDTDYLQYKIGSGSWATYKALSTNDYKDASEVTFRWMKGGVETDIETVPVIVDGDDSVVYKLKLSSETIKLNTVTGNYSPTSISIKELKFDGNKAPVESAVNKINVIKVPESGTETTIVSKGNLQTVDLSSYVGTAESFRVELVSSNNVVIDIKTISVVRDGVQGEDGYYPIDAGIWDATRSNYGWIRKKYTRVVNGKTEEFDAWTRDKVIHRLANGTYGNWMVSTKGMTVPVGAAPPTVAGTSNEYWAWAEVHQTIIADCIFGANANIGGFLVSAEKMVTLGADGKTAIVEIDGKNGSAFFGTSASFDKSGSGSLANGNISWNAQGAITFGNKIVIGMGGSGDVTLGSIATTVSTVTNIVNALSNILIPVDANKQPVYKTGTNSSVLDYDNATGKVVAYRVGPGNSTKALGLYSESFITAYGLNASGGSASGGGGGADVASQTWGDATYTSSKAAPANLTAIKINDLYAKVNEGVVSISKSGSGNAVTNITKSGTSITVTLGKTFQESISDLATIRSNASNGNTAYGWGNHASAGYFASSSFTKANIKSTLGISDWALAASKPSYSTSEVSEGTNLYFTNARAQSALSGHTSNTSNPHSVTKSQVGLGNVENTALSTWAGTSKITTLGTISTGTWHGSAIANDYLANSSMTIAGTSVSLGGSISASTIGSAMGTSKTAWGRTFWSSSGLPASISGDMGNVGTVYFGSEATSTPRLWYDSTHKCLRTNVGIVSETFITAFGMTDSANDVTIAGNLRLQKGNFGTKLNFGDGDYVNLYEDTDDHLSMYASKGMKLSTGSSYTVLVSSRLEVGDGYDGDQSYWRFYVSGRAYVKDTLKVNGNLECNSNITYSGSLSQSSDVRLKNIYEDVDLPIRSIAEAPCFRFDYKNAENKLLHIGSSAQYWRNVLPDTVREGADGWLSLDYTGVVMASVVALAKRSESHEERIKRLEVENRELKKKIDELKNI